MHQGLLWRVDKYAGRAYNQRGEFGHFSGRRRRAVSAPCGWNYVGDSQYGDEHYIRSPERNSGQSGRPAPLDEPINHFGRYWVDQSDERGQ